MPLHGPPLEAPADLAHVLTRGLERDPDGVALATVEEQLSWRELDDSVTRLAHGLLGLGLAPGDRVASLLPNRPELIVHYLACIRAGLTAVPLNYRYVPTEIDHALEVSGARAIVAHVERTDDLRASAGVARLPLPAVWFGGDAQGPRLEQLAAAEPGDTELPAADLDRPVFIFFTSGSTGPPKGVTHTGRTYGTIAASLAAGMALTADDIALPGSSMSHIGSSKLAFAALSVGASLAIARTFDADEYLSLLRERRPTVAYILPAALFALIRDHDASHADFTSLRFVVAAGDKVPAELEAEFKGIVGTAIHEAYGMTEIGTSHLNPPDRPVKEGSVGTTNPSYASSIRTESGEEVALGTEGRHWVSGPAVMVGYWENEAATAATMDGDWLDTGDLVRADEDGYLWFRGRRKQIIVHDASNINPEDVEDAISSHPAVAAAGVVGVHDEVHGENVWAYITLREGAPRPSSQDVIRFARERVGYKAPEVVHVLDKMPLTATGKVDRLALAAMAADRVGGHHQRSAHQARKPGSTEAMTR